MRAVWEELTPQGHVLYPPDAPNCCVNLVQGVPESTPSSASTPPDHREPDLSGTSQRYKDITGSSPTRRRAHLVAERFHIQMVVDAPYKDKSPGDRRRQITVSITTLPDFDAVTIGASPSCPQSRISSTAPISPTHRARNVMKGCGHSAPPTSRPSTARTRYGFFPGSRRVDS